MRELLTAVGLEALYKIATGQAFAGGVRPCPREMFERSTFQVLMSPLALLRALQTGNEWGAVSMAVSAPRAPLKLVQ